MQLVDIHFATTALEKLYENELGAERYSPVAVDNFFYHLAAICAAESEADLLRLESLPLEPYGGQYMLRLDSDWMLTLSIQVNTHSQVVGVDLVQILGRRVL